MAIYLNIFGLGNETCVVLVVNLDAKVSLISSDDSAAVKVSTLVRWNLRAVIDRKYRTYFIDSVICHKTS